ncbi:hypothetical protein SAMN02745181_2725 [Rubritalea squalenifaciens DSM 18772]|uniref:Uncharacterized protein n=2 Tax=Rubritalea TaxID=361050 RepID=A0A1M6MGJ0_9BACT|nr:hypothetical protein [Rubritalea squalenifaciens]SHJ82567.1 hypothetical protein SAMN02745181_2725 [Rubritalea squalenifaciens DSM 18772]
MKLELAALSQSDVPALTMLAFSFFALGVIATIIVRLIRHRNDKPSPEEQLIEECSKEEHSNKRQATPVRKKKKPKGNPWERDPDWWKNE